MRRNNGWLAVLAVSVVLSILRNSLAGERYPLDYGNDQLSVNRGKVGYGARGANGPSLNFQNRSNAPSPRHSSRLSSSSTSARQTSHPLVKNDAATEEDSSKAISWRAARPADANQPDEDSGDDRSTRLGDPREGARRLDRREERGRNKHRAGGAAAPTARGSTGNSVKIPREPRLSTRITRVAIKDTARSGSDATRLPTDPSTTRSLKTATLETATGVSESQDHEYPYYGHVVVDSRDDDSLKASRREIEDVRRQRGFRGELRGGGMERSDGADGQRTMDRFRGDDVGWSQSSADSEETATTGRKGYSTEVPESAVSSGKLFDTELELEELDPGRLRGSVKRYSIESAESSGFVNQPLKIGRLKSRTLTGREGLKNGMIRNVNLSNVVARELIQKRHFAGTPVSSVSVNEPFDGESKPKERSRNRRRRNKSMYQLMSRGPVKNSRAEPGDVINLERSYRWQNSGSSKREPRSDRVEAVGTEGRTHHSSEFEGSQRTSTSRKSTLTRGQMEYTRQLDGISAKQISTKGSDDEAYGRTPEDSSIREKRNIIPSSAAVALDSSQYREASSNLTFNETVKDFLNNDTNTDARTVDTELELDLMSENVTNNSLDDRHGTESVQQWNDSTLNFSISTSIDEFDSTSYDESTESVDRITLEEPYVSDRNNSQLSNISMINGELDSTLIKRKFVNMIANRDNGQLPEKVSSPSDEAASVRPDLSADSSQGMELDAPRSEIDETKEEANKATPEEGSALSNVTRESEGVLANSERGSVAATRNATYLRNDMNSLVERSYASESSGLSEFDERNSDDTFRNSSSMKLEPKAAEDIKISANPEQSAVNNPKHSKSKTPLIPSERSAASEGADLQKLGMKNREIDSQLEERFDRVADGETENDEVTFNDPLMVPRERNSVHSRTTLLPNRNIQTRDDDVKPDEPSGGFSWKNEKARAGSLDNGTVNEVNPFEKDGKSIDGPPQRPSNRFNSSSAMPARVIDHPTRERKSRSSTARTSTSLKLDSTTKVEGAMSGRTSTPMWDKDEDHGGNVSTMQMESIPARASNDTPEFASSVQDSSTGSSLLEQPRNDSLDNYLNENLTLSSTRVDQPPVTIETSTVEMVNDENQFSFAFDMIATSSEPSDEYFPVTVEETSSQAMDNSSHEREPPDQWPVKHSAVVEGDLVLGGLMMVHEREDTITCGPVMPQGGVQALEAMLYTLDRLNDRGIVPGVKIGAHILDDCDKDTYGLEMAVDFIKDWYYD